MELFRRPYKSIEELRRFCPYDLTANTHFHVESGRIAYLDERYCREKLNSAGLEYSPDSCAEWLRRSGAVLSESQFTADFLSPQPQPAESCNGYRPPRYGRAAIFETRSDHPDGRRAAEDDALLLDVKGCGVSSQARPLPGRSTSGLLPLHFAITEVINARLIDFVFSQQALAVRCVPILGIVDLGIWSDDHDGAGFPCATLVRQVHIRPADNNELPLAGSVEEAVKDQIEAKLFKAGLTSTGYSNVFTITFEDDRLVLRLGGQDRKATDDHLWELMRRHNVNPPLVIFPTNVQIAHAPESAPLRAEIVDLSHYKVFAPPPSFVTTLVDDRPFNLARLDRREVAQDFLEHAILDAELLRDRELCEDARFGTILGAFPKWRRPHTRISGASVEALRIAALFCLGEIGAEGLKQEIGNFVQSCTRGACGG